MKDNVLQIFFELVLRSFSTIFDLNAPTYFFLKSYSRAGTFEGTINAINLLIWTIFQISFTAVVEKTSCLGNQNSTNYSLCPVIVGTRKINYKNRFRRRAFVRYFNTNIIAGSVIMNRNSGIISERIVWSEDTLKLNVQIRKFAHVFRPD